MIPIAVALQQAEAARVFVEVGIEMHLRRIGQRPPDPLARSGPHRQAVGVMDLRAPIVRARAGRSRRR